MASLLPVSVCNGGRGFPGQPRSDAASASEAPERA